MIKSLRQILLILINRNNAHWLWRFKDVNSQKVALFFGPPCTSQLLTAKAAIIEHTEATSNVKDSEEMV